MRIFENNYSLYLENMVYIIKVKHFKYILFIQTQIGETNFEDKRSTT
jgi:hypothetical protein